jgi:lipopolysaccharide/colanic/teichoic acid biosynthesis glycosyltransferase
MKRLFDIIISLIALTAFTPLLFLISITILVFNGFPILFVQPRLGKDKEEFNIVKFRTMNVGKSKSSDNDEMRQTLLGKFLRKSSLDELPVLINVLKGEMSLVGPRPLLIKYSNRFNSFQNRRHEVLPGITGLAQIKGRNQISWEEKFIYDVQYIDEHNFLLDIKILFKTMKYVLFFKGTSPKGQDIMPEFMGSKDNENN